MGRLTGKGPVGRPVCVAGGQTMAGNITLANLIVRLKADTAELRSDLRTAGREVQSFTAKLATTRVSLNQVAKAAAGVGVATAALGALVKVYADYEQAVAGVAKTVDASEEEIAALGQAMRQLSKEVPISANELLGLAESAGQLGIRTDAIQGFVETVSALGVSTNLAGQEAATGLARLANVMGTAQDDFDRMGAAIVDLGNNLATTEREILDFATRMAGAGRVAGLTEADVLAIGGALSSVGVQAEAGGTAIQRALIDINTAVASGSEELADFAEVAGMTAAQFQSEWRTRPAQAFAAFVEGLSGAGDDAATILADLFGENQRLIRAFLAMSNAGGLLGDAIQRGNTAWEENTALTKEASRFYGTLNARFQMFKNRVTAAAATLGQALAPAMEGIIGFAEKFIDGVEKFVKGLQIMAAEEAVFQARLKLGMLRLLDALPFVDMSKQVRDAQNEWSRMLDAAEQVKREIIGMERPVRQSVQRTTDEVGNLRTEVDAAADSTDRLAQALQGLEVGSLAGTNLAGGFFTQFPAMLATAQSRPGMQFALPFQSEFRGLTKEIEGGLRELLESWQQELEGDFAPAVDDAVRGVASLADTVLGLDDASRRAIRAVSDLIGGVQAIQGGGGLASQLGGFASIAGAVAGIAQAFLGNGETRAEREARLLNEERNRILERNQQVLEQIRDASAGVTERQFAAVAPAAQAMRDLRRGSDLVAAIGTVLGDFPASESFARHAQQLVADFLEPFDIGIRDFVRTIKATGIELFTEQGFFIPEAVDQVVAAMEEHRQALLKQEAAFGEQLRLRELEAKGREGAADILRMQLRFERELAEAREQGFSQETIARLREVQQTELDAARAAREQAAATGQAADAMNAAADAAERVRTSLSEQAETGLFLAEILGGEQELARAEFALERARTLDRLLELTEAGAISMETYNRALDALDERMRGFYASLGKDSKDATEDARQFGRQLQNTAQRMEDVVVRNVTGISTMQAATLTDLARSQLIVLQAIESNTRSLRAGGLPFGGDLPDPGFFTGTAIHVGVTVNIHGDVFGDDLDRLFDEAGRRVADRVDMELGHTEARNRRLEGDALSV